MLPKGTGVWGMALIPMLCCLALPLLLAAGLGFAAFALLAGTTLAAAALAAAVGLLVLRARRSRAASARAVSEIARRS
ncbi:MAG: hypothetical protein LC790_04070 [Actinobacteria bacterium]|nr:hypothetical protein [Actinomycetota bacterium]